MYSALYGQVCLCIYTQYSLHCASVESVVYACCGYDHWLCSTVAAAFLLSGLSESTASCPNTTSSSTTKPLYLLSMVSIPRGYYVLPGHRIAQDEINNRSDLLPGYHIELIVDTIENCSSNEAGIGLSNLLKHTLRPPCRPVVAVAGLGCSSHTQCCLLLLAIVVWTSFSSPRPILRYSRHKRSVPHLWRLSGSATVYSDVVVAILDQYNWSRIGIVYNTDSLFHSEMARHLEQTVSNSTNKTIEFSFGLAGTRDVYLKSAIFNIRNWQTTIIISMLTTFQTAALFNMTKEMGVTYPTYLWIMSRECRATF